MVKDRFVLEPSFRLNYYASLAQMSPEPRLGFKYNISEKFRFKFAGGLFTQNFLSTRSDQDVVNLFAGFLSGKDKARAETLAELAGVRATLVFFETAPRLVKALEAVGEILPGREVAVARELTKLYEECRSGTAADLAAHYTAHPPRGEIVLLIGPPAEQAASPSDADALLRQALETEKPSQAAAQVAKATGLDRKALYARALELRTE